MNDQYLIISYLDTVHGIVELLSEPTAEAGRTRNYKLITIKSVCFKALYTNILTKQTVCANSF